MTNSMVSTCCNCLCKCTFTLCLPCDVMLYMYFSGRCTEESSCSSTSWGVYWKKSNDPKDSERTLQAEGSGWVRVTLRFLSISCIYQCIASPTCTWPPPSPCWAVHGDLVSFHHELPKACPKLGGFGQYLHKMLWIYTILVRSFDSSLGGNLFF